MDMIGKLELVRESLVAVVKEMRANIIHSYIPRSSMRDTIFLAR